MSEGEAPPPEGASALPTLLDIVVAGDTARRHGYQLPPAEPAPTRAEPATARKPTVAEAYLAAHVRQTVAAVLPEAMQRAAQEQLPQLVPRGTAKR